MRNPSARSKVITSIIFDMDATLLDTSPVWKKAETRLYRFLGSEYHPGTALLYKGMSPHDVGRAIYDRVRPAVLTREACGQKLYAFLLECYQEPVAEMPGAGGLIERLAGKYRLAVASGSPREAIKRVMGAHHWIMAFPVLVSSEEVERGKPAPDVFLKAADRLGAAPEQCLVIEDSLPGVRAAKAAGMACFAVPSLDDPRIARTADKSYPSLAGISPDDIQGWGR